MPHSHQRPGRSGGEVAAGLNGLAAADPRLLPEHAHEAGQPVVPVVVAGDREQSRVDPSIGGLGRVGPRQRRLVRADEPVLIVVDLGDRIHLVAAEDHDLAAWEGERFTRRRVTIRGGVGAHRELTLRCGPRHGVRGVETVAAVGDEVEPELGFGVQVEGETGRERRLQLALVEVVAERTRQHDLEARAGEHARAEPANRRALFELQFVERPWPRVGRVLHQMGNLDDVGEVALGNDVPDGRRPHDGDGDPADVCSHIMPLLSSRS